MSVAPGGVADVTELHARLAQLQHENERLYSHHSACKQEIGHTVEIAQRWRIRAYVAEKMLRYLNKIDPQWYPADLSKEIHLHVDTLMKKWRKREVWWDREDADWMTRL